MAGIQRVTPSRGYSPWAWILQAASGILLVILLTVHFIAQHFTGGEGVLSYHEVIAYLRNPAALLLEVVFLICALFHALGGVRAILLDLGLSEEQERRVNQSLTVVGVVLFVYGVGLLLFVV